jgi:GcrA cell cycle regulator
MASWSKERVAALKELAATELTLREIGERMKERFGIACTKDSVKRKIDGLGLSRRTNRWSDERVAVLTDLAAKNLTMSEIGRQMTERFDTPHTKDMVREKMGRLGLSRRQIQEEASRPTSEPVTQPQGRALLNLKVAPETCWPIRYRTCQYPIGEPGRSTFRLCGDPAMPGKPYCEEHGKRCFVRLRDGAHEDPAAMRRRGDVIAACPGGETPTRVERAGANGDA